MRRYSLLFTLFLAFTLRIIFLDRFPYGFTPDEASFGYDAYSILKTGKDQWGNTLPLVLESFGDFKPPLYAYITFPFVALFGLERWVVRFPNALLGTAAVYVTYLLAQKLNVLRKKESQTTNNISLASISAVLLAISPWHVMLSRGAFEANLTTFFIPLGLYFLIKGLKDKKYLNYSAIALGLNLFSYHSARLITPLILFAVLFIYRKRFVKNDLRTYFLPISIFIIFFLGMLISLRVGGLERAKDIGVMSGALQEASVKRHEIMDRGINPTIARLMHNKYQVAFRRFTDNYTQYTSYKFLFKDGPAEATYGMIPGRGVLYWFELPFILGFIYFYTKSKERRFLYLILFWVAVAPIPAALTMGKGFAANRAAAMMPGVQIFLALGAVGLWNLLKSMTKSRKLIKLGLYSYIAGSLLFVFGFIYDYFYLSPEKSAKAMLQGNLEASYWLSERVGPDDKVIVSRSLSEPHIYVAFAYKWDPSDYQEQTKDWERYRIEELLFLDQLSTYSLGKFRFTSIDLDSENYDEKVLLVGRDNEFPENTNFVKSFYYPNGEPSVRITYPERNVFAGVK